ncbi:preprotein translocase subunit YajC [Rickettsiaceae bacterium]|nr:preprotein translocase subunit YajC [Rickettsiaceae bacterium]
MEADTIALQETETAPNSPESMETSIWSNLVPMLLIFVVFYFLLIRPQEKKRKEQEALVLGIKKGEEVLTNSGLFGTVTKINDSDNTIILQIAKDTEIKILKNSIADITSRTDNKEKKKNSSSNKASKKKKKK